MWRFSEHVEKHFGSREEEAVANERFLECEITKINCRLCGKSSKALWHPEDLDEPVACDKCSEKITALLKEEK